MPKMSEIAALGGRIKRKMKQMTLGSLFDGIGGWQLAAIRAGVKPLWSSEIEKFPCAVTARHFPEVKQLGDITKIDGAEIEPVDIICAGSPCQDLSVAGKQEGLKGARSGLFLRAVDIVRDMRRATNGEYPRFFVWENVPGAFSSNRGMDFRAVLEAIGETEIPMPRNGRWASAGLAELPKCEIAWRTLDAQYWGVAQRRKRIFLVADFAERKRRAGEILFERKSLFGHTAKSEGAREGSAAGTESGVDGAGGNCLTPWDYQAKRVYKADGVFPCLQSTENNGEKPGSVYVPDKARSSPCIDRGPEIIAAGFKAGQSRAGGLGYEVEKAATLSANCSGTEPTVAVFGVGLEGRVADTLDASYYKGPGNRSGKERCAICVYDMTHADEVLRKVEGDRSNTLNARMGTGGNQVPVVHCLNDQGGSVMDVSDNKTGTLRAESYGHTPIVHSYCIAGNTIDRQLQNGGNGNGNQAELAYTLNTVDRHAVCYIEGSYANYDESDQAATEKAAGGNLGGGSETLVRHKSTVRRLTPLECERLQGLPDNYTLIDDKSCSDTARYKALGNGMAQPCADWVMKRIVEVMKNE